MFVENYYKAIQALTETHECKQYQSPNVTLKSPDGVSNSPYFNYKYISYSSSKYYMRLDKELLSPCMMYGSILTNISSTITPVSSDALWWNIAFGNGDTEPTIADYALSGELISTLSVLEQNDTQTYENGVVTFQSQMVVKNTGANPVTLSEVALFYPLCTNKAETSVCKYYMMERSLLDEPVIIEAGCSANVNYKVSYTVPAMPS